MDRHIGTRARRRALLSILGLLLLAATMPPALPAHAATPAVWTTTNTLPTALNNQVALTDGTYIYVAGGSNSGHTTAVWSAAVGTNGVLSAWHAQSSSSLPVPLYNHTGVLQSGYAVILGGQSTGGVAQANVYTAPAANGIVGAWTTGTNPLPVATYDGAAVASGGYVWHIGGFNSAGAGQSTVYVAQQQSNGTVGPWIPTTSLPVAAGEITATVANNWIYVAGGHTAETGSGLKSVYAAPILSGGALGSWVTTLPALPAVRWDAESAVENGFLWVIAGYNSAALETTTVYRAPVNPDGSIGAWAAWTPLPGPVAEYTLSDAGGYFFVAGNKVGAAGSSATIYTALINTTTADVWPEFLSGGRHQGYNSAFNAFGVGNVVNGQLTLNPQWPSPYTTGGNVVDNPAVALINGGATNCSGVDPAIAFAGSWNGDLYAINATTGTLCWKVKLATDIISPPNSNCITQLGVTSAPTVATITLNGVPTQVVYAGASDLMFAVYAQTGLPVWSLPTELDGVGIGQFSGAYVWSSPTYSAANNTLYTSVASFCDETNPVQGTVYALDPATGVIKAQKTISPPGLVGDGVWGSPTIDPSNPSTVYVTTGNSFVAGSNPPVQACVKSDQYSCSILALDATTLAITDHWQAPQATHDDDFGTTPVLFPGLNGDTWLAAGNKDGWLYVLDSTNLAAGPVPGTYGWSRQMATGGGNPIKGIIAPTTYYPGTIGNCTGVLFVAAGNTTINGMAYPGSISALCADTDAILWRQGTQNTPGTPGTTGLVWAAPTLANGLLADQQGGIEELRDWTSGAVVWSFNTGQNIYSAATFANGRLYFGANSHNLYAFGL